MSISLIITAKNEKRLQDTIQSAKENADNPYELIVITDGKGVDIDRHKGIMQASNDLLCISDGHMIFQKHWDTIIKEEYNKDPLGLYCTQCERIHQTDYKLDPKHERHYGASIITGATSGIRGISARWIKHTIQSDSTSIIPCILGGFYAFSQQHYLYNLLAPWSVMKCYGKSEEVLSLINYKLGNNNYVIERLNIAHMFRTGEHPPYMQNWNEMLRNAVLLSYIAGETDEERSELLKPAALHVLPIKDILDWTKPKALEIEAMLSNKQVRSWQDYLSFCSQFQLR